MKAKPEHEVAYQELVALCSKHKDKVTAEELLAIAANLVGKLMALQDQRTMTPRMAFEIVLKNVEAGNQQAMRELTETKGNA